MNSAQNKWFILSTTCWCYSFVCNIKQCFSRRRSKFFSWTNEIWLPPSPARIFRSYALMPDDKMAHAPPSSHLSCPPVPCKKEHSIFVHQTNEIQVNRIKNVRPREISKHIFNAYTGSFSSTASAGAIHELYGHNNPNPTHTLSIPYRRLSNACFLREHILIIKNV